MKTIKDIDSELSVIQNIIIEKRKDDKDDKCTAWVGKANFLKQVRLYLETNPTAEYLQREIARLETLISNLESKFDGWKISNPPDGVPVEKLKSFYNNEMGINHMKSQLKT